MKPTNPALALALWIALGGLAEPVTARPPRLEEIGQQTRAMVEADWLTRDGGSSVVQTREGIRREAPRIDPAIGLFV